MRKDNYPCGIKCLSGHIISKAGNYKALKSGSVDLRVSLHYSKTINNKLNEACGIL